MSYMSKIIICFFSTRYFNFYFLFQGLPYVELKGGDKWPLFSVSLSRKVILYIQVTVSIFPLRDDEGTRELMRSFIYLSIFLQFL